LTIHDGEYVFILGPSGCGKTTLLRLISGLTTPTTGKIIISGNNVTLDSPQSRNIAFVFQHFEIFPMTVWDNCVYSLVVRGYEDDYIIQQGEKALNIVGLLDRAEELPINWGNGDLQRLGLARAICSGADILIMDEPLGSLDPKISAMFRWELRKIIKETHLTAVQVTHNQEEAMNVGDRIIIMRDGHLLQQAVPETLYNFPNSLFVGNFLGGMNVLEGFISHRESNESYEVNTRLGGPKLLVKMPPATSSFFELNEIIVIAFRYEDVYLFPLDYDLTQDKEEWVGINQFEGEIADYYLTGKEKAYVVQLDTGDTFQVWKPEVMRFQFKKGEKILVGIYPDEIHLFKYPLNLQKEVDLQ
jgi:ABC-type Fe3+/spermidine/putrescine transport system ATPase subunit